MTISKEVIHAFVNKFGQHVQPNDRNSKVDDAIKYKDGIELVTYDILGLLRSTVVSGATCPSTGRRVRLTCREFFERVFNMSAFASILIESVKVVVVCIDRYGARRVEKTATTNSRKRSREEGQPDCIPIPRGQRKYFQDSMPMPGELTDIFESAHIKAAFYDYLTKKFTSEECRRMIPEGKRMILSGALRAGTEDEDTNAHDVTLLSPLEITRDGFREMTECDNSGISEGDLDALYWPMYVFPKMHVHVHSYDSDVLFIFMMSIRRLLHEFPERKCWFITRRSDESRAPTEREVRQRTETEQKRVIAFDQTLAETGGDIGEAYRVAGKMYSASTSSSSEASSSVAFRAKPVWKQLYFDVAAVCKMLYEEANERLESRSLVMRNPVEVNVLALLLASQKHDYIQTRLISPGVGPDFVWPAFGSNLWKFSELVLLTINGKDEYYYSVSVADLRALAISIYDLKGSKKLFESRFPSVQSLHKLAAQCVWTLQYWGNGTKPGYSVIDGTTLDPSTGRSLYGYTRHGWADSVSGDARIESFRCCPMIAFDENDHDHQ